MKNKTVYIRVSKLEKNILEPSLSYFSFFFSFSFPHSLTRSVPSSLSFLIALHQFRPPLATTNNHRRGPARLPPNSTRNSPNDAVSLYPTRVWAPGSPSLARLVLALLVRTTLGLRQALASSIRDQRARPRLSRDPGTPSDRQAYSQPSQPLTSPKPAQANLELAHLAQI